MAATRPYDRRAGARVILVALAFAVSIAASGCDSVGLSGGFSTPIPVVATGTTAVAVATLDLSGIISYVLRPSTFTGTFAADGRPLDIDFMSLVQSGNTLSGYITFIKPVGESTSSQTVSLTGTVDGDSFFLSKSSFLENAQFSGRRVDGNQIILSFPSQSGQIGYRTMVPATQAQFNNLLYEWQGILSHRGGPYLGVHTIPMANVIGAYDDRKDGNGNFLDYGEWVATVVPGSPAAKAGLRAGDVILALDEITFDANHSLGELLSGDLLILQAGETVTLHIMRQGKRLELKVTVGARP